MPSEVHDVEYWRKRAEEARTLAEEMQDSHTKALMMGYEEIAKSYEKIANFEKRSREPE